MLKGGTRHTVFSSYATAWLFSSYDSAVSSGINPCLLIYQADNLFQETGRKSRTHSFSQIMIGIWMAVKAYLWHITWNRQTLLFHSNIMSRQYACDHYCILNTIQKTYTRPQDKSERRDKSMCISIMFFFNNGLVFLDIILSKSEKF